MKKALVTVALVLALGTAAMGAGTVRDNCGCGLGTMALGDMEPTILVQVGATFLNTICGNQTFGITSGTLDCEPHAGIASNQEIRRFVTDNMDHLAMDMATGQGDALEALADLMDVPAAERPGLYARLQEAFGRVFTSQDVTADDVLQNLDAVLKS